MDTTNLCLGILCLGDASGYEIKKTMEQSFSHFQTTSFGSIYPTLGKLSDAGLVNFTQVEQEKRPAKKVFQITPEGRKKFHDTLMTLQPSEQYKSDFLVMMMFAHLLPTERLSQLLEQQTSQISEELELLSSIKAECKTLTPGMRFTLEYGIAVNRSLLELMNERKEDLVSEVTAGRESA